MKKNPFLLVPWQEDFLQALLHIALRETGGNISRAVFIFPHGRPKRYLSLLLRQSAQVRKPLVMPRMVTVPGLFADCAGRIQARPAWSAGLLDRVGLLLACVRQEQETEGGAGSLPLDAGRFFHWGARLSALFEECFAQHRQPLNFLHVEDQVSPYAAMLLSRLGRIFERYVKAMREREWSTPGFNAAVTADHLLRSGSLPSGVIADPDLHPIFLAGFHTLTGTENLLFRHLWEQSGARVVLHGDPALAAPDARSARQAHWSCERLAEWAREWRAKLILAPGCAVEDQSPRIRYYQGFDLHSQLTVLERELAGTQPGPSRGFGPVTEAPLAEADLPEISGDESSNAEYSSPEYFSLDQGNDQGNDQGDEQGDDRDEEQAWEALEKLDDLDADHRADTLIALPDTGLLMPVLHHLPRVEVNISMGYPLNRSPVFRLLDTLACLQENRKAGGYYWRDLISLIRHPYLKMLRPEPDGQDDGHGDSRDGGRDSGRDNGLDEGQTSGAFRRELHRLEEALRRGRRYADPASLAREARLGLPRVELPSAEVLVLLDRLFKVCLDGFSGLRRPCDLAVALENLCAFLLAHGRGQWKRFPIDAECLHRLRQSLIPELGRSRLAGEDFGQTTLFILLRKLMEAERVPFEAVPLVGLQVMGMLETRLLSFRRVILLEAAEDVLPGSPAGDPLLPEALRPEIGLPGLQSREQAVAYTFFRLLAGAEEVVLLWQEGNDPPGIQEQRKKKSRFVEELLWQEEKRLGRLLATQGTDGPLHTIESRAGLVPRHRGRIPATASVRALMTDLLGRPVSASLLDSYLRCPVRFFHERLSGLAPAQEVSEGDDPLVVGQLLHSALQEAYLPHLGLALPGGEAIRARLEKDVTAALLSSSAFTTHLATLPADSARMLKAAGVKRLSAYLDNQPPTTVKALESELNAVLALDAMRWPLTGTVDRLDVRQWEEQDGPEPGLVILDYKTGHIPQVSGSIWEDPALWRRVEQAAGGPWSTDGIVENRLFLELSERMESVQLPFYLLLHSLSPGARDVDALGLPALDAAWVDLGRNGEEIFLFPATLTRDQRLQAVNIYCRNLILFLLRHMQASPFLIPRPGKHCRWCLSAKLCTVSAVII